MSNKDPKTATIFVQLASYRDPETQWTIKDAFEKASNPDRVFFGICWQYDPHDDAKCFEVPSPRPDQVRINPFHWRDSKGVCWARHQAQQLWNGEDFVLMIDSHMRFVQGWDEKMIVELQQCDSNKPLISCHPAAYTPPNNLAENPRPTILRAHPFNAQGEFRCRGDFLDRTPEKPLPGAFVAGGHMFASSDVIREVPYDPHMYFTQEEISLSVRYYTHGWDVFSSPNVYLYHYYIRPGDKHALHWSDHKDWARFNVVGQKRVNHLLGHTPSDDPEVLAELDTYGLGKARSLAQFEEYAGVNFKNRTVNERGLRCGFIPDLAKWKDKPIFVPEIDNAQPAATAAPVAAAVTAATKPANGAAAPVAVFVPKSEPSYVTISSNHPALQNTVSAFCRFIDRDSIRLRTDVPEGIMMIENYITPEVCNRLARYADSQVFTDLNVVDHEKSTKDHVATVKSSGRITNHVEIDGLAPEVLTIFNDVYCHRLAPFYNVNFEWYERPQILRYPAGGLYNQHADSEHWVADKKEWIRTQDRDYSVLLYLNEEYEGGELDFPSIKFKFKPKTGMLAAFPSDHRYLHAALPTTSGVRYVIVSWAGAVGHPRCRDKPPYASVFVRQKRAS